MDSRLEELRRVLESAVEGMSSEQMHWHANGKWCAAEVLEHLFLSYTGTIKGFEKVLAGGKPLTTPVSIRQRWGSLVVGFGYLPKGRKAPATTQPKGLAEKKVRNELASKIAAMDAIIAQCEGRIGAGVKLLDHPVLGPLTGAQWRKFHLLHGQHHAKQLHELRRYSASKKNGL